MPVHQHAIYRSKFEIGRFRFLYARQSTVQSVVPYRPDRIAKLNRFDSSSTVQL